MARRAPPECGRWALAFEVVRLEGARGHHPFGHQTLDVSLAVFAALGVEAGEGFERRAFMDQVFGEVEQALHGAVPGHQLGRGVEHGDRLIEQVEPGEQQVEPAPVAGADEAGNRQFRQGRGRGIARKAVCVSRIILRRSPRFCQAGAGR